MNRIRLSERAMQRLIVLAAAIGPFIAALDANILYVSMPTISSYFNVSTSIVSWILIVYLIVITSFLLIFGKLGDAIGHKKVFMTGASIFTVGSLLCSISQSIFQLIGFRILQGFGAAMLLAIALAIISISFPHKIRGRIYGYISLAAAFGLIAGMGIGGFVTEYMGWRWVFLVNVPIGIIAMFLARAVLPATKGKSQKSGFDILGALFIFSSIIALLLGLNMGEEIGWLSPLILGSFFASIILGAIFFIWELRHHDPVFDLSLLKNLHLTLSISTQFMSAAVFSGTIFLVPYFLELVKGYSTDYVGLIILAPSLIIILIGPVSGHLSDRMGCQPLNITAGVFLTIATILLALLNQTVGLLFIFATLAFRNIGNAMFSTANTKLTMSHSPVEKMGTISGLLNTARYLGSAVGIVIFETVFDQTIGLKQISSAMYQLPMDTLLNGFENAFIVGVMVSLLIIVISLFTKERP